MLLDFHMLISKVRLDKDSTRFLYAWLNSRLEVMTLSQAFTEFHMI